MKTVTALVAGMLVFTVVGCGSSSTMAPTAPSATMSGGLASTGASVDASARGNGRSSLPTIAGIAVSNADFSTLVAALAKAGLVDTFSGNRHFTVFAPNNAAFDALAAKLGFANGPALVEGVDVATLTGILTYHVTRGDRNATSVVSAGSLLMLDGNVAKITTAGGNVYIENAKILATDIRASNGLIHVIEAVILPPQK